MLKTTKVCVTGLLSLLWKIKELANASRIQKGYSVKLIIINLLSFIRFNVMIKKRNIEASSK
jgi:hypothetical protein